MITIEPVSLAIGAGAILLLYIVINLFKRKKKPKYDLYNLKKLVQDGGNESREVYKKFQELGNVFNDMEKSGE